MIVNNKYKVYWVHTPLFKEVPVEYVGTKVTKTSTEYSGYNRAFSDCIITYEESSSIVAKDGTREMATKILTQGRAVVHPPVKELNNKEIEIIEKFIDKFKKDTGKDIVFSTVKGDTFDRKKGVYYSFKNAMLNISSRELRKQFWKEYWRIREAKPVIIIYGTKGELEINQNFEEIYKQPLDSIEDKID